ncbi:molybdopterin-dependent oxidoreductase [Paenibacillus piri]|uniref:Oxidoreductase molybdopterin-binding domain-containing protein n=1 Tax=Paenibacillus piri TaxID=2547395 RepID=A0A4R5KZP2_9BACL|nr:molybdopterin-dependent oxidoreductase [Paenibacillus piri]TDG00648.1 hypothetical protein E1757_03200 [Paenibacillus piri]
MKISIWDEAIGNAQLSTEELKQAAPLHVTLEDRVPGVEGRAFDVKAWYRAQRRQRSPEENGGEPLFMTVEAVDEFQATIPWDELDQAVFLYEQNGAPLQKGFPIRLYVPDGSSECLNVKSVVSIRFGYRHPVEKATYGFKNEVSIEELKLKK